MNALLGQKVAIVTPHPQTTRTHLLGVLHRPDGQVVFIDTPGVHRSRTVLNREMMRSVQAGLEGRDLALLMVDVTRGFGAEDSLALDLLQSGAEDNPGGPSLPTLLVLNKIDRLADKRELLPIIDDYRKRLAFTAIIPVSALKGEGLDLLTQNILEHLPEGPEYFPAGQITDQPERFTISEIIREKAMALTRAEVPHTIAVQIERLEASPRLTSIGASIVCERPGQKAILVGHRGEMIRRIGTQARQELEPLLGRRIFLELHVLVREDWRENPRWVARLNWRREEEGHE